MDIKFINNITFNKVKTNNYYSKKTFLACTPKIYKHKDINFIYPKFQTLQIQKIVGLLRLLRQTIIKKQF